MRTPVRRQRGIAQRRRYGFTLIEVITSIVVLAILGSVASQIIWTASDGYVRSATLAQLHAEVSMATERTLRELRSIPAADGAPVIHEVTTTSIGWGENGRIALENGVLSLRDTNDTDRVLMRDVEQFVIRAFDAERAELSLPRNGNATAPIRSLAIEITAARNGVEEHLRGLIYIRSVTPGPGGAT